MDEFEAKIFVLRKQKYDIIGEIKSNEHSPEMIKELKRQKRIIDSLIKEAVGDECKRAGTNTQ